MCASGLTIFGYILRQIAASALAMIVIAVITMLLSKLTRKGIFALLAALVIFILGIIPDVMEVVLYNSIFLVDSGERYFLPRPEFYRLLKIEKLGNPISLFQIKYFARRPRVYSIRTVSIFHGDLPAAYRRYSYWDMYYAIVVDQKRW